MGTAFNPAKTSPASWNAFSDVDAFVDAVLAELAAMAADGTRRCSGARRPENGVLPWFLDHQAARTDSGRPRSSIRLRTVTAIRVSTSWVSRVCERKVSPMMRLYRLIAPSAPALAL